MHANGQVFTAPYTWTFARLIAQPADIKELFVGKSQAEAVSCKRGPIAAYRYPRLSNSRSSIKAAFAREM